MLDFTKRRMELMGLNVTGAAYNSSVSAKDLKDLLSARWRSPKNPCEEICHRIYLGGEYGNLARIDNNAQ